MNEQPEEYIPYGPEWEAEVMKNRKADIVDMLRSALIRLNEAHHHVESACNHIDALLP